MRVMLVTETFFPAVDGTTTTVRAVADRLVDSGHRVHLLAPGPGLGSYRGCPITRIRPLAKRSVQVREGPVLTTCHWMTDRVRALGVEAALWTPGVDTRAFTPALRDDWLRDRWTRTDRGVAVGHIGSLRNRHDVRRLAVLARVPGIRPVVIGAGPQRGWLEDRLPGARFTGALGTGDLAAVLPSLDLLVQPGTQETCCHPLREAAASGVPVVAPRAGGAPDVVRHLETGLLYDPDDARGLVRAVGSLVADRSRSLLGERARELTGRTWSEAVDELVDEHYHRLVAPVSRA